MIERELADAKVAFSTRAGGVSRGAYESLNLGGRTGDEPGRVAENRARLAEAVGVGADRIACGRQLHQAELHEWAGPPPVPFDQLGTGDDAPAVDGHLTSARGLALLVLVADCYPVALAAADAVAMLHCGWRGVAAGIVGRAAARLEPPTAALVGPGIGGCCYAVGDEVATSFASIPGAVCDGRLDLRLAIEAQLAAAGVASIEHVDLCTSCRPDLFYSHRRDGSVTGRQAGLIWRPAG